MCDHLEPVTLTYSSANASSHRIHITHGKLSTTHEATESHTSPNNKINKNKYYNLNIKKWCKESNRCVHAVTGKHSTTGWCHETLPHIYTPVDLISIISCPKVTDLP